MLTIDGNNNITLTRGDTLTLTLALTKDGEPYVPEADDIIRFAVSKGYKGEPGYELKLEKVNGSWVLQTDVTNVFDSTKKYVKGN